MAAMELDWIPVDNMDCAFYFSKKISKCREWLMEKPLHLNYIYSAEILLPMKYLCPIGSVITFEYYL